MFNNRRVKSYRGDGNGVSWPHTDTDASASLSDIFGPRTFTPHISTIGYDYDFHRGIDILKSQGSLVYSPINGSVIRTHFTHFGWETNIQLQQWTEVDPNSSFACSINPSSMGTTGLTITGSRVGVQTFPTDIGYIKPIKERVIMQHAVDPWVMEMQFSTPISVTGSFGFGLLDTTINPTQYVALEYNGNIFTTLGNDADGSFTTNGNAITASGMSWARMNYQPATTAITYSYSTNGSTFTTIFSESNTNFTNKTTATFTPIIYWRSIDTDTALQYLTLSASNWYDAEQIARFGNWIEIADNSKKILIDHFQELLVKLGQFVHAGQSIGTVGSTGFDSRSGRVLQPHIHLECVPNTVYIYSNDDPLNPISSIYLPISQSNINISGTLTSENDPLGNSSHKLLLVINRAGQEFDLNKVSLTGNTTTRTINFNTRTGLASDNDIPVNNGVYIVPTAFSESSTVNTVSFYFNKSVVGNSFISYSVVDTNGITVASG